MITIADLRSICPNASFERLELFVEPLNEAMAKLPINNPEREAMFIAQIANALYVFRCHAVTIPFQGSHSSVG